MRRLPFLSATTMVAATWLAMNTPTYAANLLEVYDQAAQSDPTIRAADASRLATREARPQVIAQFLPSISAGIDYANGSIDKGFGSVNARGGNWGINVKESINIPNLLRSYKSTGYTLARADLVYHQAEMNLVTRVATLYFNVLAARDSLSAAEGSLVAFNKQLDRAEKRFEVGLSAITDVQEARASRDRAAAGVIAAKRSLSTAQEQLREVTGEFMTDLAAPGDDMPLVSPNPQNEDAWVQAALNGNLDLAISRINLDQSSYNVGTQKLTRWPTLTLGAHYNNNNEYQDFDVNKNTFNTWDRTWVSAGISVPIFSGGAISSNIRQAVYNQRAAEQTVVQVTRQTERAAHDAYLGVLSSISLVQANKQALESSRLALQATEAGFEVGTRTNIDVLNARQALLTAEQAYAQSRYGYINNLITLKTITGSLKRDDLIQINSWLVK